MIEKIELLKGPDRVRKRPAVIFGSDGVEGAGAAAKILLDILATEAMLGCCTSISVTQDKEEITVSGDDRGLYLGQDLPDGETVWQSVFCQLLASSQSGPDEDEYHYSYFEHHHGLLYGNQQAPEAVFLPDSFGMNELCMLQYVCESMHVVTVRNGVRSELNFRRGYPVGGIQNSESADGNGTTIRFKLDPEVFSDALLAPSFFIELLRTHSILIPGLRTCYRNTAAGIEETFRFSEGIAEYVQRNVQSPYAPVFTNQISATGKERYDRREYQAIVKAALCFVPRGGVHGCYHNLKCLQAGGTHLKEIMAMICDGINSCFRGYIEEKNDAPIRQAELEEHLYLVVETWCSRFASVWENGTRQSIRNVMIKDMAHDLFATEFLNYLHSNKQTLCGMVDEILSRRCYEFDNE